MVNEYLNPQGYNLGGDPTNTNPFWSDPKFNLDTDLERRVSKLEGEVEDIQKDLRNLGEEIHDLDVITNRHTEEIQAIKEEIKILPIVPVCAGLKRHIEVLSSSYFNQTVRWEYTDNSGPVPGITLDSIFTMSVQSIGGDIKVNPSEIVLSKIETLHNDVGDYDYIATTFGFPVSGLSGDIYIMAQCSRQKLV